MGVRRGAGSAVVSERPRLPLNPGRAAFREGLDLREPGHGHIARECRGQGAMGPSQADDLIQLPSVQHSVDQPRGEAVATADAVDDTEFTGRRDGPLPVIPDHGPPLMTVGGFNLPQGGGHHLHIGEVAIDLGDHLEEDSRVELGPLLDIGTLDAQTHLQVLLVADEDIDMLDDSFERALGGLESTDGLPQLAAVVQIEGSNGAVLLGGLHGLDDELGGRRRQCGVDASGVEPAHAFAEDRFPVEVARFEHGAGFIGPVVEDNRRPDAVAEIAVDGGDVRSTGAIVLEPFVEGSDAHFLDPGLDQLSDAVVHHGSCDPGLQTETIRQVCRDVVLTTRDVDRHRTCFPEWDSAWIQAMDQGAQGQEIESTVVFSDLQFSHEYSSIVRRDSSSSNSLIASHIPGSTTHLRMAQSTLERRWSVNRKSLDVRGEG